MLGKELQGRSPDNLQPGWVAVVLQGDAEREEGKDMRGRKTKGFVRVKGRLLQFITAFGLTLSVTAGFFFGYWAGKVSGNEFYTGIVGALVGFGIGLGYLIWLAGRGNGS